MNKKIWIYIFAIVIIALGIYVFKMASGFNPLSATYFIDGKSVHLKNGESEVGVTPDSAIKITTTVFGAPVLGDLDGDGKTDAAMIIVQNLGGSGTFYYVAAALNTDDGAKGTNAILLGDRIAPQNIEVKNGQIIVNYADRAIGDPMTTLPSIGISKYFVFDRAMLRTSAPIAGPGERCGGNTTVAPICEVDYHCAQNPNSHLPFGDLGGTCIPN